MKHIIFTLSICFFCFCLSCSEIDQSEILQNVEAISNEYDIRTYDFALALNKAISENTDFRNLVKSEVIKQVSGDYELLLSHAFNQKVRPSDQFITKSGISEDEILVKDLLAYYYTDSFSPTKSSEISLEELVNEFPDLQISIPRHAENWDAYNYTPDIAIVPSDYEEFVTETVPGINSSGESINIDAINEPEAPVIVVGLSERIISPLSITRPPMIQNFAILLHGVYSNGAVRLTYGINNSVTINSIRLFRTDPNSSTFHQISNAFYNSTEYADWNVIEGKEYSYYVVIDCQTSLGQQTITSNTFTIIIDETSPLPVSNLSVVSHYGTKNYLSWSNPMANNYQTRIYKTTPKPGETYKLLATLNSDETDFYDEPTVAGEKWFYFVKKYNANTDEESPATQAFLYNPYRNPSDESLVMLKKIHINRNEVESWLAGKPEFYITTYGYEKTQEGDLKLDTLSTIDLKFYDNSDDSQDLNNLMANWSFFDDSEYYPILNINVREYDKVTFATQIEAQAKIGKKLADDISIIAKGTFSYEFQNKNKDCGTVTLRYYENPEKNLTFANYGTYITISEYDDFN